MRFLPIRGALGLALVMHCTAVIMQLLLRLAVPTGLGNSSTVVAEAMPQVDVVAVARERPVGS